MSDGAWSWRKKFTLEMIRIVHAQFILKGGFRSCLDKSRTAYDVFRHIDWEFVADVMSEKIREQIPSFSSKPPSPMQCREKWRSQFRFTVNGYEVRIYDPSRIVCNAQ